MRRWISGLVGLSFALMSAHASAAVMLGAHVGAEKSPGSKADFVALETALGRKLAIDNDHEDWADFPNLDRLKWDAQNGRLSMLSWRIIFHRESPQGGCATADAINSGAYDNQLRRQAEALRAFGRRILVRFNYEMTNNEENTCFTGFKVKQNPSVAGAKYVAAWKHVVDIFRSAGATNVEWVWAPGHKAYAQGLWKQFFPGAVYVDWIGIDYYNKQDVLKSFADDPGIQAFYSQTAGLGKPLMVAETGAVNDPRMNPDPQTRWLMTARAYLRSRPAIKAFLWWDTPGKYAKQNPGYGGDGYRLSGSGLAAFRDMADDPYFQ